MKRLVRLVLAIVIAATLFVAEVGAQISYTVPGNVIEEKFDSLPYTGSTSPWTDNQTLPGWFLVNSAGAVPTQIYIGNGSTNTGAFYSFGATGSTERAFGGVGSGGGYFGSPSPGALAGYWGVKIVNNTGVTLTNFQVKYDMEQWRDGGNTSAQPLISEWAIEPPSWFSGSWNLGASTDSPQHTSTARALDGNDPANRVADVTFESGPIIWAPGQTVWIRFRELNDYGNDHGLAIDNFRFLAIPEPTVISFGLIILGGWLVWQRRNR